MDVKLRTGGALTGYALDHSAHGLVILREQTPYVFSWEAVESGSAYTTRRALLISERGGDGNLTAEDHFQLGLLASKHGRTDLAGGEFAIAKRLDPNYMPIAAQAMAQRRRSMENKLDPLELEPDGTIAGQEAPTIDEQDEEPNHGAGALGLALLAEMGPVPLAGTLSADQRAQVLDVYRSFASKVQEVLGKDVVLVESEHFLITTDWEQRHRDQLAHWCEAMYRTLCAQFKLEARSEVFLAKCPLFCWRSKHRFVKFARLFDGYSAMDAVGYTRSIEANGHVHVAVLRQGAKEIDFSQFACTLIHEGTHAFLHRLYSTRLIPHWVNEGYAELLAERTLGDRCPNGETASLLAKQFVRFDWPIRGILERAGPIEVHEYPIAHSVVAFMESLGSGRLAGFIKDLKAGDPVESALAAHYDAWTLEQLEAQWRRAIRSDGSAPDSQQTNSASRTGAGQAVDEDSE